MTSALLICPTYLVLQHFTGTAYKVREPGLYTATYVDVRLSRESSLFRLACTAMTYHIISQTASEYDILLIIAVNFLIKDTQYALAHPPSRILYLMHLSPAQ